MEEIKTYCKQSIEGCLYRGEKIICGVTIVNGVTQTCSDCAKVYVGGVVKLQNLKDIYRNENEEDKLRVSRVKEFIKNIKIDLVGLVDADTYTKIANNIDKRAGDKLI